jgi:hypothetical protein
VHIGRTSRLANEQFSGVESLRPRVCFTLTGPEQRCMHTAALFVTSPLAIAFNGERAIAVPAGRLAAVYVPDERNDGQVGFGGGHGTYLASLRTVPEPCVPGCTRSR